MKIPESINRRTTQMSKWYKFTVDGLPSTIFFSLILPSVFLLFISCEPLATQFSEVEEGEIFRSIHITAAPSPITTLKVMTWNIRFGAGDLPWFGDACGERVILSEKEVLQNLQRIADLINETQPDILLVQEIDIQSKRSAYINQIQWLLNRTHLNYAAYASVWKAQVIPSDGLGRMNMGNAVFSRWPIKDPERIQLPLRGDQDGITQYFYLQRNILKTRIALPEADNFYILNTHLSAFSTDDTKLKQVKAFKTELSQLQESGAYFIAGGDFNLLPPGSDSTDFCMEDRCPDESFHNSGDNPQHKEGSNYTPEIEWMSDLYDNFLPAIPLTSYLLNQDFYFTHTTAYSPPFNRKLDYLFTNYRWVSGSDSTHQQTRPLSDHAPLSNIWEVPQ